MIPNPVTRRPGSMPRMRIGAPTAAHYPEEPPRFTRGESRIERGGGVHVLHVVERIERVEESLHSRRVVALQLDLGGRLHRDLGERRLESGLLERTLDRLE